MSFKLRDLRGDLFGAPLGRPRPDERELVADLCATGPGQCLAGDVSAWAAAVRSSLMMSLVAAADSAQRASS